MHEKSSARSASSELPHLLERRRNVVPRGIPLASTIIAESARGSVIRTPEGAEFIDFASGIGVMGIGHSHPDLIEAVCRQVEKLQHVCIHIATYEPYVELCERLVQLLPHGPATKAMLLNSGAEAVENAIKIARQATGRSAVLCYEGGFHGRTLLGMSLTSKVDYKTGCGPFAPEIYRLAAPDHFRWGYGLTESEYAARELHRFDEALKTQVSSQQLAAVLIEPVQGEGGFVPIPRDYLIGLRRRCDEHGIMLIFDEVQTGFCRTGAWGAYQKLDVVPDLSTWAKALGGGLPISAVVGRAQVMDAALPGTIGGTYGGNPVAAAAALATLEIMDREALSSRAEAIGARIRARLESAAACTDLLTNVRGMGAMIAIEFCRGSPQSPAAQHVSEIIERCHARGLLIISAGTHKNVIRILAPLNIDDELLDRGLDILTEEIARPSV